MNAYNQKQKELAVKRKAEKAAQGMARLADYNAAQVARKNALHFIAIDSEGVSTAYDAEGFASHTSVLWAASDGESHEIMQAIKGLDSFDIIEWIFKIKKMYQQKLGGKIVYTVFGGNYDFNMLIKDLPQDVKKNIHENGKNNNIPILSFVNSHTNTRYRISMRPRKSITITRLGDWDKNKKVYKVKDNIQIYDVIGFFQNAFIPVVEKWLGQDYHGLTIIKEGKKRRADFTVSELDYMRRYTTEELIALVKVMDKFAASLKQMDLQLTMWHGAGAVASAGLKKHRIKAANAFLPDDVLDVIRYAFFGGRIELLKFGYTENPIHVADINSAYPNISKDLPNLNLGVWRHAVNILLSDDFIYVFDTLWGFALIEWETPKDSVINPFPYRSGVQNKVLYPSQGTGWYTIKEVLTALSFAETHHYKITVKEIYIFEEGDPLDKPFSFIDSYYHERQELINQSKKTGIENGAEYPIKLFLNSIYGKTCQGVGGRRGNPPTYNNYAWAAWVTGHTRAMIMQAIIPNQDKIIMVATDGIYSTEKLDLQYSESKELGLWEYNQYQAGCFIQSGFYFLKSEKGWSLKSRGFDKIREKEEIEARLKSIVEAWGKGADSVLVPCTRFVSLASSLISDNWNVRHCHWYQMMTDKTIGRKLRLSPAGTKRVYEKSIKPASKTLLTTMPENNLTPYSLGDQYISEWLEELDKENLAIASDMIDEFDYD